MTGQDPCPNCAQAFDAHGLGGNCAVRRRVSRADAARVIAASRDATRADKRARERARLLGRANA